ncbi:MAG: hypothetical protein LBL55_01070, partial [Propionibacteriaceae bacterium]|nr:hypothetical protein [Propionibacteriaceae bacterium]
MTDSRPVLRADAGAKPASPPQSEVSPQSLEASLEPNSTEPTEPRVEATETAPAPWRNDWFPSFVRRLIIGDVIAIALAVTAALTWRFWLPIPFTSPPNATPPNVAKYCVLGVLLVFVWLLALGVARTRSRHTIGVGIKEYQRVVSASVWVFGLVAIGSYALQAQLSRSLVIMTLPVGVFLILINRWTARQGLNRRRMTKGEDTTPVVVVGDVHE